MTYEAFKRHKWLKLKLHNYVCLQCGALKENYYRDGLWIARYEMPDGSYREPSRTPPCQQGPRTNDLLAQANDIADSAPADVRVTENF